MINFCAIALCMIIMGEWVVSLGKDNPYRMSCNAVKAILLTILISEIAKII
jgi:hypothetical protein